MSSTDLPKVIEPTCVLPRLLIGQRALVTGANSGIGRAVAVALGQAGADVVVNWISGEDAAGAVVREIRDAGAQAYAHRADITSEDEVAAMFAKMLEEFGSIDILVSNAGVDLDSRGFVVIDDVYQSTAPGVYAVGDASGEPQFTHVSWDDHRILFDVLMGRSSRKRTERTYPHVAFTDPQVAGVGPTEREARERGLRFELASLPYSAIARSLEVDEPAGLLKVLVEPDKCCGALAAHRATGIDRGRPKWGPRDSTSMTCATYGVAP